MSKYKETAVIYGLGRRFFNNHFLKYTLPMIEDEYIVKGVSDKNKPEVAPNVGNGFIEKSLLDKSDIIIVTSDVYYDEIKREFNNKGIYNVISIDDIEKKYICKAIPLEMFNGLSGVEVGGPSSIFRFLYPIVNKCDGVNFCEKTAWWNKSQDVYVYEKLSLGKVTIADAIDMSSIESGLYDFYISSNNLEHIANPIKALYEAKRILKEDGLILIVVPRKEACFDHYRKVTSIEHLIGDFNNEVSEDDLSHLDEIVKFHDFEMDSGVNSIDEFKERALKNFYNRCLHHHVFDEKLLSIMFEYMKFSVISTGTIFENYYVFGRV